ncbi:MAG TPA: hypothetical protein VN814_17320 [Caulobacteraceae bacterium]|nr:hypothetical protein [Caulobacteraceae bacterium]
MLFAVVTAALAAAGAAHAAPAIGGGVYDNSLILGVDPATGAVSGYFDMSQGGQPSISCIFYLKGWLAGRSAAIDTFFPDDPKGDLIRGSLSAQGPGKVRLALPTEHGGCGNVWQFADQTQPADFALQGARPWTSVRVVKAAKAYFSPAPGAPHGKAYIVKGDGVGVRGGQAGWVQADFVGETRTSSGWLREADLYAP